MTKSIIIASLIINIMMCHKYAQSQTNDKTDMIKTINPLNMELSVKPGNNFYLYVNGGWIKNNPVPPEYSQYGAFTVLFENNQKQLKELVDEVSAKKNAGKGSIAQKIRDFYNSGMDSDHIKKLGVKAISSEMESIDHIKTKKDVESLIARMQKMGSYPLFYFYADADQKNSSMEIANLYQGGLGLPDIDYYRSDDDATKKIRKAYKKHIEKMLVLAGEDKKNAENDAEKAFAIENKLSAVSFTRLERRNPEMNYNKMNVEELQQQSPAFDWKFYFTEIGLSNPGDFNVSQLPFFKGISNIYDSTSVEDWKAYLRWNLLNSAASYLSKDFVEENFDFYGRIMSGQQEIRTRWKRVLATTSSGLGEALGQLYVEKYFPPKSKIRMLKLVENLRQAFAIRIKELDWMSEETKQKALEKLDAITVKVGYPDKWKDYEKLEIVPDNYYQNVLNTREFDFNYNLNKIGKPVDKSEWGMTPQTVNAYYNPSNNEIVFPAGILQPPFFNKDADDAVNYGAIGVVIGHEMTHGFDDQGRKYDKDGNLNDWWTAEDAKRFNKKIKKLQKLYDNYTILDSLHVNGQLTMGENIADLGGLNISYEAYQMTLHGITPKPIDGFSANQRFFMGFAQVWRQNIREKEMTKRLKTDVHSPGEARVNIPPFNMKAFLKAFNIQPGDRLYIEPDNRAIIW